MEIKMLVSQWFEKWETGDYQTLPLSADFVHTSPYGKIKTRKTYMALIAANKKRFLGHRFKILDAIYDAGHACVRYEAEKDGGSMEVSEWYYSKSGLIDSIVSYYNLADGIREDQQLKSPGDIN